MKLFKHWFMTCGAGPSYPQPWPSCLTNNVLTRLTQAQRLARRWVSAFLLYFFIHHVETVTSAEYLRDHLWSYQQQQHCPNCLDKTPWANNKKSWPESGLIIFNMLNHKINPTSLKKAASQNESQFFWLIFLIELFGFLWYFFGVFDPRWQRKV